MNVAGRLESADMPMFSESVSIVNVSSNGARIIAHRNWQPHDRVILSELVGDFHTDAAVIYCRRLRDEVYVVGLKFYANPWFAMVMK
jgi:hypothetical protein